MQVSRATPADLPDLARLIVAFSSTEEQRAAQHFTVDLAQWWERHRESHVPFLARAAGSEAIGMAWLALLPRVPRPGALDRTCADVQSVYVVPAHRATGVGLALVRAAVAHAEAVGVADISVRASAASVPVYERAGFAATPLLLRREPTR